MRSVLAVACAACSASLFALSTSLQALDAREEPAASALRASLLARLLHHRRWLLGTAAGVAAWPLQAAALALASVALVQPALGLGLVVLLVLGTRLLGEGVGRRELGGVAAIAGAVAVLGWSAPPAGTFTRAATIGVIAWLAAIVALPAVLRAAGHAGGLATSVAAGLAWAWVGVGTALLDHDLSHRRWLDVLLWGLGLAAASAVGLLAEMTSLQAWPATRAVPIAFALEMVIPAAAVPGLSDRGAGPLGGVPFGLALVVAAGGAALLGGSRSVARSVQPAREPLTG